MSHNNRAADDNQAHQASLERELEEQLIGGVGLGPRTQNGQGANGTFQPTGIGMQPKAADLASKLTTSQAPPKQGNYLQQA